MNDNQLKYKIAIGLIPKIGPVLTKRLIAYCGNAEAVFREKKKNLAKIPGIAEKIAGYISGSNTMETAEKETALILKHRINVLFYLDHDYPERLRQCEDAPIILYLRGNALLNRKKVVSIVGTRNPTDYGRSVTRELIDNLSQHYPDLLIVSGLAYGIDICAHRAALKNNLDTAGVLGHGFSLIYPSSHRETAVQMVEQGILITEFLFDTKPDPPNFVKRNRIVAGLADATIVVESGEKGGALITADIANSYNRDVFAFPGRANDRCSAGCNKLIKTNRAAMIEHLNDLEYLMGWKRKENNEPLQKELFTALSEEESKTIGFLQTEPGLTIDRLSLLCDMPVSKISALMLNLEFKGMVKCLPGKVYKIV